MKLRRSDIGIAVGLAAFYFALLAIAQLDVGIPRDEGIYFHAAKRYLKWFQLFGDQPLSHILSAEVIDTYWKTNAEHPVLMKTLFAFSYTIFHDGFGTTGISAMRLPTWVVGSIGVSFIYLFGCSVRSRFVGLAAAALFICIPRVFFHNQLSCFDGPVVAAIIVVAYSYFRSLENPKWGILTGVAMGVAISMKHNALFVPFLLGMHYIVVVIPDVRVRKIRVPLWAISTAFLSPIMFYLHWPKLWHAPIKHLTWYFTFHAKHVQYEIEYFGNSLKETPFPIEFPFVMMAVTLPLGLLILGVIGMLRGLPKSLPAKSELIAEDRSWKRPAAGLGLKPELLWGILTLFPLCLIALPNVPIFGGTKHWITAYPFFCLFAAVTLSDLLKYTLSNRSARTQRFLPIVSVLLLCAPGIANTVQTHPFYLSQYSAWIGGPTGGANIGFTRQFWGFNVRQDIDRVEKHVPKNGTLYPHDMIGYAYSQYRQDDLLRKDIRLTGEKFNELKRADALLLFHELHWAYREKEIWRAIGTPAPVEVFTVDGVPVVSLYANPKR